MNNKYTGEACHAIVTMVPVAGVSQGIVAGLKTVYAGAADQAANGAALSGAVPEYCLPNERLLAYAARNPPPQNWYDEDEDLF
jgi:hypothetical protein